MLAAVALFVTLAAPKVETFIVSGVQREAIVVAPSGRGAAPLVFVYHGHGGNMNQAYRSFAVHSYWPEAVVAYPQGLHTKGKTDPEGNKNGWQQNAGDYDDRDLAFFDTMLAGMKKEFNIDPNRIYAMGHSNGGRFTYLLWAERGDTFAAVSPSASPAIGMIRKFKPIPAFIIAGEQDQIVPFQSQELSIAGVRRILRTDPGKAKKDGYLTTEPGPDGIELATYVFPGPHSYPPGVAEKVVAFFKRHHH